MKHRKIIADLHKKIKMWRWFYLGLLFVLCLALVLQGGSLAAHAQEPEPEGEPEGEVLESPADEPEPNTPIKHFMVIMQENHTFDNYFGTYPGANGIPEGTCMPVDPDDPENTDCVEPFRIGELPISDLDHSKATGIRQYNDGKMDGFVSALNARNQDGSLSMGYYDRRDLPYYWNLVDEHVLFDNFFSSAEGGSVWNHNFWVAGGPGSEESRIPEEGYGDDVLTIFDRLEEKNISWKFYVQNYDPRMTYHILKDQDVWSPQIIWVPILNFPRFVDNPELFKHIVHMDQYYEDLENGTLPAVAYMVPSGASEHPPGSIRAGQSFVRGLIQGLMKSDYWESSAFMVTYDDWGGWYDHVPPPRVDEYGYGFRVPAFMVSAYAKEGYIDSTLLDFTSVMKFIEENWNLEPVAERDAKANSFMDAFDFEQPPRPPVFVEGEFDDSPPKKEPRRDVIYIAYSLALIMAGTIITFPKWQRILIRRKRTS